ncbi:hypothetical protein ACI2VK_24130 [Ralstonia nicotianae]|nr:hypothetical protein [Ralstonia solanacearum]
MSEEFLQWQAQRAARAAAGSAETKKAGLKEYARRAAAFHENTRREIESLYGVRVAVSKHHLYERAGENSGKWPGTIVAALCKDPTRARLSNATLMADACRDLGLSKPLAAVKLSQARLSKGQRTTVQTILDSHGYRSVEWETISDIKRLIRDGYKSANGSGEQREIRTGEQTTTFGHDHVSLSGRMLKFKPRRAKATGNPLEDNCVRIEGVDVPMFVVTSIREIVREEAEAAMRAALAAFAEEQARQAAAAKEQEMQAKLDHLLA